MHKIKSKKKEGILILSALWIAGFSGAYAQYQLAPLAYKLVPQLNITNSQFSTIFTAPMIPAVFLSIFGGVFADRFGTKRLIGFGLAVSAIGLFIRPFSDGWGSLFVCMLFSGLGVAFLNSTVAKIIRLWFPPEKLGSMLGIFLVASTLGMATGTGTTALFRSTSDAFWVSSSVSIIAFIYWILFMDDKVTSENEPQETKTSKNYIAVVVKNYSVWIIACALMFLMGGYITVGTFLPAALKNLNGLPPTQSGLMSALVTIGNLLGVLLGPRLCRKAKSMKVFIIAAGFLAAAGTMSSILTSGPILPGVGLLLLGFSIGSILPLLMSFPVLLKGIGADYAGSAGGFISTFQLLGAVVIPSYVITPIAGDNLSLVFLIAAFCFLVMSVLVFFLPKLQNNE